MELLMRAVLALLAIVAVASCQASPGGRAYSPAPQQEPGVQPSNVQSDVAAILNGMNQARTEGLRRAAGP
jgi:hypothetical protein